MVNYFTISLVIVVVLVTFSSTFAVILANPDRNKLAFFALTLNIMEAISFKKTMPKSNASRWVALDFNDKPVAEGNNPDEVRKIAEKLTKDFILVFVPIQGASYVL